MTPTDAASEDIFGFRVVGRRMRAPVSSSADERRPTKRNVSPELFRASTGNGQFSFIFREQNDNRKIICSHFENKNGAITPWPGRTAKRGAPSLGGGIVSRGQTPTVSAHIFMVRRGMRPASLARAHRTGMATTVTERRPRATRALDRATERYTQTRRTPDNATTFPGRGH